MKPLFTHTTIRHLAAPMLRGIAVVALMLLCACSVSYKFNGASIDYSKTKSIQIADFPIRSSYVWGPMGPLFNNQLKDQFANHTRLQQVKRNGDLKIEDVYERFHASLMVASVKHEVSSILLPFAVFNSSLPFELSIEGIFLFGLTQTFKAYCCLLFDVYCSKL